MGPRRHPRPDSRRPEPFSILRACLLLMARIPWMSPACPGPPPDSPGPASRDPRISSILRASLSTAQIPRDLQGSPASLGLPLLDSPDPRMPRISSILRACRFSMARMPGSPDLQHLLGLPLDGLDPLENRENCQGQHYQLAPCAFFYGRYQENFPGYIRPPQPPRPAASSPAHRLAAGSFSRTSDLQFPWACLSTAQALLILRASLSTARA
ncbi:hypothetical protein CTA2_5317 [Colletotrichum tanaceti]|uniref:Uncharacterized protein n=1 Tax=Colletotrichum tanaceti TaxID=1306861 RepID=A0A4U6XHL7_9PEZI|nr:hypothetical protein CTA2_5317 [Colletotrichum tanaceti]TKW55305.1 hypothetical protein CTA1_953 [Colletotrichum tanaceti]